MAELAWSESYLGRVRAAVGPDMPLLLVGARVVVRGPGGEVLLIRRSDNGLWALPAGAMEVGESVTDCAARELFEETGLVATGLTLFAVQSDPESLARNMYGHPYQQLSFQLRADTWRGDLRTETSETTDARFHDRAALPSELTASVVPVLAALDAFERTGAVVLH